MLTIFRRATIRNANWTAKALRRRRPQGRVKAVSAQMWRCTYMSQFSSSISAPAYYSIMDASDGQRPISSLSRSRVIEANSLLLGLNCSAPSGILISQVLDIFQLQ